MAEPVVTITITALAMQALGKMIPSMVSAAAKPHAQKLASDLWDKLRTREGKLPKNHDLQRASRQALCSCLLVLAQSLDRDRKTGGNYPKEESHWIQVLWSRADQLAKDADKEDLPPEAEKIFGRFDGLLGQGGDVIRDLAEAGQSGLTADASPLKGAFHTAVDAWLRGWIAEGTESAHTVPPGVLGEWLADGFDYLPPDPSLMKKIFSFGGKKVKPLRVTLFDVWAQCFFERLKDGQRAFRAYLLDSVRELSELHGELGKSLSGDLSDFTSETRERFEGFVAGLSSVSLQITELSGLTREGFEEVLRAINADRGELGALSSIIRSGYDRIKKIEDGFNEANLPPLRERFLPEAGEFVSGTQVSIRHLHYEKRWLPRLLARDGELEQLRLFLDRPENFLWWGIVGDAGMGKSRIALDLVIEAQSRGWRAGFLDRNAERPLRISDSNRFDLWRPNLPTLIVVDYASDHGADIASALAKFHGISGQYTEPVRILLLDRQGAVKPLFTEISQQRAEGGTIEGDREVALTCCHRRDSVSFGEREDLLSLKTIPTAEIPGFLADAMQRSGMEPEAAVEYVAAMFEDDDVRREFLRVTGGGRPLLLQLYGLAVVRRAEMSPSTGATGSPLSLVDDMLRIEVRDRWSKFLAPNPAGGISLATLQRAVAVVTMCRGLDLKKHGKDLARSLEVSQREFQSLQGVLAQILGVRERPDGGVFLRAFEPDLLAEHFILMGGVSAPCVVPGLEEVPFQTEDVIPVAFGFAPEDASRFLGLALDDMPVEAASWLAAAIRSMPDPVLPELLPEEEKAFLGIMMSASPLVGLLMKAMALHPAGKPLAYAGIGEALDYWALRGAANRAVILIGMLVLKVLLKDQPEAFGWIREGPNRVAFGLIQGEVGHADLTFTRLAMHFVIVETGGSADAVDLEGLDEVRMHLVRLASEFESNCKIQELLAGSAVNAISRLGIHQRWDDLSGWGETLRAVASSHPENEEIQLELAKGAMNAITHLGTHQRWDDLSGWGETLRVVASLHPENEEIQLALAKGAVNAINYFGTHQRWDDLSDWGESLRMVASLHPESEEIQLELAKGAMNAISHQGTHQRWDDLSGWGEILRAVASLHPENEEIQSELAKGAVNAISDFGTRQRWDDLSGWGEILKMVASSYPENEEIQLRLARGAMNAIIDFGTYQRWDELSGWGEILRTVASLHPENEEIQLILAQGAVNAITEFGIHQRWDDLSGWGESLRMVASLHPENEEIQLILAQGAVNAIIRMGNHQRWNDLPAWGETLKAVASSHPENEEIREQLARGAILNLHFAPHGFESVEESLKVLDVMLDLTEPSERQRDVLRELHPFVMNLAEKEDSRIIELSLRWRRKNDSPEDAGASIKGFVGFLQQLEAGLPESRDVLAAVLARFNGLLDEEYPSAALILSQMGVDLESLREKVGMSRREPGDAS